MSPKPVHILAPCTVPTAGCTLVVLYLGRFVFLCGQPSACCHGVIRPVRQGSGVVPTRVHCTVYLWVPRPACNGAMPLKSPRGSRALLAESGLAYYNWRAATWTSPAPSSSFCSFPPHFRQPTLGCPCQPWLLKTDLGSTNPHSSVSHRARSGGLPPIHALAHTPRPRTGRASMSAPALHPPLPLGLSTALLLLPSSSPIHPFFPPFAIQHPSRRSCSIYLSVDRLGQRTSRLLLLRCCVSRSPPPFPLFPLLCPTSPPASA